jgi:hypothetical protein
MQTLVNIFESNAQLIQKFIFSTLRQQDLSVIDEKNINRLQESFPSLELVYECDETFQQRSPNFFRGHVDKLPIGEDRSYLVEGHEMAEKQCMTDPYISTATGKLCVTVVQRTSEGYLFLDFTLSGLLERFDLIESNTRFRRLNRYAYALMAGGLLFFGVCVVLYGFYEFGTYLLGDISSFSLDVVFKPVIALTLGLAVFDLGKTIFEQEVLPHTHNKEPFNVKTLTNFLVSILIALFIEALLAVFKIALHNYRDLPYAAVLIVAISLLFFVFAWFVNNTQNYKKGVGRLKR